ncbi:MAG TPA: Crp/Fnr family transcriptional regulator [Anaerolineales bacterium]|nr:Crp/Fnr family transcriptional regulator [Anaerolineales bacterium]
MLEDQYYHRIAEAMPFLKEADSPVAHEFRQAAYHMRIPAGRDIFVEGDAVQAIALMLSGNVRVYKVGENGRQITLYRFGLGESCILTANAILNQQTFPAIALVESEAEAIMIPSETFRAWIRRYDEWRAFLFDLLSQRLASTMAIVDEVVFRRMDARVAALLLRRADQGTVLQVTHQEIAAELGTSREVVSRILEGFAAAGSIEVTRGQVEILDAEELSARSEM